MDGMQVTLGVGNIITREVPRVVKFDDDMVVVVVVVKVEEEEEEEI